MAFIDKIRQTFNRAVCVICGHRNTWGKEAQSKRNLAKSPILGMPYDFSKPQITLEEGYARLFAPIQPHYYILCLRCGLKEDGHTEYHVPYSADGNYHIPDHVGDTVKILPPCSKPPSGWWCSRQAGHDGPCAAREKETQ